MKLRCFVPARRPRPRFLFLSSFSLKVLAGCDVPFGRRVIRQLAMQAEHVYASLLSPSQHPSPSNPHGPIDGMRLFKREGD